MNAVSSALLTGGLVLTANVLDNKKPVTARQVIGTGVYLFLLAAVNQSNSDLADKFALLVLVGVVFVYLPAIVRGLGLS